MRQKLPMFVPRELRDYDGLWVCGRNVVEGVKGYACVPLRAVLDGMTDTQLPTSTDSGNRIDL